MYWTAFLLGLAGSLHCVGMCGPIAMALPFQDRRPWKTVLNMSLYQGGRILTYGLLGLFLGLLGMGLWIAGIQTYLSIALGILLLSMAFLSFNVEKYFAFVPWMRQFHQWVQYQMSYLLKNRNGQQFFLIGMVNGLIPCGLVYMAVIGALTTSDFSGGFLFMVSFGLGTLPLMFSMTLFGNYIGLARRRKLQKLMPVLMAIIAVLFLYRGIEVHLPADYRFLKDWNDLPMCHD